MVQTVGGKHLAFDQTKVRGNVGASGFVLDLGMTHGIETVFVGPRVEGREIIVVDFFSVDDQMMELDGVGPPTKERVSGLEPRHKTQESTIARTVSSLFFFSSH